MATNHRTAFTIGDKVIDCAGYKGKKLTERKGTIIAVTITAENVFYQIMATGGSKFAAKEGALVHESGYDLYLKSLINPVKSKHASRLAIQRKTRH